jgi:LuxR family maltose regulon positive regulatory protein
MMTYFLDCNTDSGETYAPVNRLTVSSRQRDDVHLLKEKLLIPTFRRSIKRPRLYDLLDRSTAQFPATLVSGRAGTGKTLMASAYARTRDNVAWYAVESSDAEWNVFANYFASSVLRAVGSRIKAREFVRVDGGEPSQAAIASFLIDVLAEAETVLLHKPLLIVLDGIHHLFDAPWFGQFFGLLLSSLPENASLLLLCRSKPPNPLWRLRSKQQLNVVDEKVLAFDLAETVRLMTTLGLRRSDAERAHATTFGRASKLTEYAEHISSRA